MLCVFQLKQNVNQMDLKKIIAISGRPGLYELVTQTRSGIVAQSLLDGKRMAMPITQKLSVLGDIQIYALQGEVPLEEVFKKLYDYEEGAAARVQPKAPAQELEAYFFEVFDDYDENRVYASDIKKVIQWYNLLLAKNWRPEQEKPKKAKAPAQKSSSKTKEA